MIDESGAPELMYPYFEDVPQVLKDNLEYRIDVLRKARIDKGFRSALMQMSADDSLFWLSTFCFLYEPRPTPRVFPFIPWTHQVPVWKEFERWMGYCDAGLEKSRGEGASWIATMLVLHKWLFSPLFAAGLVSKDEASVDNPDNPDSLFWKLDWQLKQIPEWMSPPVRRIVKDHSLVNLQNEATIIGFAATPNVATGGRKSVFIMDELAKFPREGRPPMDQACMDSTQHVTDSRILISTPWGPEGAYYRAMHEESDIKKIKLHWSQNPSRTIGAYRVEIRRDNSRRVELVDLEYWLKRARDCNDGDVVKADLPNLARKIVDGTDENPFNYRFMITGEYVKHELLRSVWYDTQCRRAGATPKSIAQELDLDYGGSSSRYFDIQLLERLQREQCIRCRHRSEIIFEPMADTHRALEKPKIRISNSGRLLLWFDPDLKGNPPPNRNYCVGCDIGAGTGGVKSSNSTIYVIDRESGKQMAEFAAPDVLPGELAAMAVAISYWFKGRNGPALLGWECNGPPGSQFTKRIMDLEFSNIFYRNTSQEQPNAKQSKNMGWFSNNKTKPALLGEWGRSLESGENEVLSRETIEEAKFYMNKSGGKIEHVSAGSEEDPSGAGERHGDRVIAAALAWWLAKEYRTSMQAPAKDAPPGSFLARRNRAEELDRKDRATGWQPKSVRRRQHTKRSNRSARNRRGF